MSYEPTVWVDGDHVTSAKLNKLEQGVNSMSYVPTVWNAGDVVTAEKLNKLEQGVAEGGGGGSSDFTTAKVGFINTDTDSKLYAVFGFVYVDESLGALVYGDIFTSYDDNEMPPLDVVLYKSSETIYVRDAEDLSVSGDATYEYVTAADSYVVTVTGDCTITAKGLYEDV